MLYLFAILTAIHSIYWLKIALFFNKPLLIRSLEYVRPPVSILICVRNGADFLKTNIPHIIHQDYPEFELILAVDENSQDDSIYFAKQIGENFENFQLITLAPAKPGKKELLYAGIRAAKYDWVLLTDADCRPASAHWIKSLADCLHFQGADKKIVLGYSPVIKTTGWLNAFSRFENQINAMLSFAFARAGLPYTAVGRNLLYHKSIFDLAATNPHIPYGDDDLLINKKANAYNTAICLNSDGFVFTHGPDSVGNFIRQKRRHLSASLWYKTSTQFLIFPFYSLIPIMYFFFFALLCKYPMEALALFSCRTGLSAWMFCRKARLLNDSSLAVFFPILEFVFAAHLLLQAPLILFPTKRW